MFPRSFAVLMGYLIRQCADFTRLRRRQDTAAVPFIAGEVQ